MNEKTEDGKVPAPDERLERIEEQTKNLRVASHVLVGWLLIGGVVILIYSIKGPIKLDCFHFVSVFTNGLLIACASVSVGVILGFLFGIPRTLQHDNQRGDGESGYDQRVNTNLEQISDWLTKILVGVGLTQLAKVPEKLQALASYFGPGVGDNGSFALAIILNFSISGFVMGYILTRLFLAKAFFVVDSATDPRFQKLQKQISAQALISIDNQDTIKAVAYTVLKEIVTDPLQADRRNDPATQKIMQAASQKVLNEPSEKRSVDDWLIAAYAALQNGKYEEAVSLGKKAVEANPPKELLWRVHNLLGLSYHYQQPDDWEKGQPEPWYENALESYRLAIQNASTDGERLLSRANRAYLYLDTARYDECESEINDILAKSKEIEPSSAVYDLVRLLAAALNAVKDKPTEAANYINEIKDLPRWKYLFEGRDISSDIVERLVKITEIKPDYRDFLKEYSK